MKEPLRALALALACALVPARAAADEPTIEVFMEKFRQAMKIQATAEMTRLVRSNQKHAVESIVFTCVAIGAGTSEELERQLAAFRAAWTEGMKTGFVDRMYEYHSLLRPQMREQRATLQRRYVKLSNDLYQAQQEKNATAYPGLAVEFEGLAAAFEEVGDQYYASQNWLSFANCNDELLRGEQADMYKAFEGYTKAMAARDKIELRDRNYEEMRGRNEYLERRGYGKPADAPGVGPAGAELSPAIPISTRFALLESVTSIERPTYWGDEVYSSWSELPLRGKGSTATFPSMEASPSVIRAGASEVVIDTNGDGSGDVTIPLTGKITPISLEVGQGDARRPWAFFAMTGNQRDVYQGFDINLEPDDQNMRLFIAAAASVQGIVGETPIQVIDDNLDGAYGSAPKEWAYLGLSKGHFQRDLDSIVVGGETRARPWSELQKIGEAWYKLEAKNGGKLIEASPAQLETGTLRLEYKGPEPSWIVVRGTDKLENSYFDVLQNGRKGTDVPIGRYKLFAGFLTAGKRREIMKALILPGEQTPTYKVEPGEVTTVELGEPFGFDFELVQGEESVKVVGASVVVTGVAGERYERLWNCQVRPEASVRKAGTKKGSRPERIPVATGQGDIDTAGYEIAWHPYDLDLPKKRGDEGVEVQLVEKKHKLFGKVESAWKD